jgi:hypothetical protein
MGLLGNILDAALAAANVMTIVENHTEAKTPEQRKKKRERRVIASDLRNAGYLARRLLK